MQGICRVILIACVWEINQHLSTSVDVIHETGNFILCKERKETYGMFREMVLAHTNLLCCNVISSATVHLNCPTAETKVASVTATS